MNDFTLPHRLVKASATISRWLLWPVVAFWVLFLIVWGGLHGWIVPRIGDWRPLLEQEATRALGVPVRIGALTARSQGLLPTFEMDNVTLLDAQGRAALTLPRVVGTLSPGSLWNLGFEQLFIDQPELDIRRTAQGKWLVAGLDFAKQPQSDNNEGADWLLSQTEFFIRKGTVRWTDELRRAPPLSLSAVDLVLRNSARKHGLRVDATPPTEWGQRFSLQAQFRQPLLSTRHSHWQEWDGQVFGNFDLVDVSQLRQYADLGDLGVDLRQGRGALRLWGDVARGQMVGATADAALYRVDARLAKDLAPLELQQVLGRVSARALAGGFEFSTEGLQFQTSDGLRWPGGNVFVSYTQGEGRLPAQGEFRADRLDLAALSQIANRVPLGAAVHTALSAYKPKGLVERVQARWQGRPSAIETYSASGRVVGLNIAAQYADANANPARVASPGATGLNAEFELTQAGGKAHVSMQQAALEFPGVFDEAAIPVDQLSADAQWQINGEQFGLQLSNARFANVDAQGEFSAQWHTADAAKSSARSRFPGVLDLQGSLSRADGARVYRYLPKSLPKDVREYVHQAVQQGQASSAKFRVKGDLADMPFTNPKLGEFRIAAQVRNVTLAYVPKALQTRDEPAWPPLAQLAGELVFERSGMQINGVSGSLLQSPLVALSNAQVQIPDLQASVLSVNSDIRGPMQDLLRFVATSPLSPLLGHGLDKATGTGLTDAKLHLTIPLQTPEKTKVQGSLALAGNDLHFTPDSPILSRARGTIQFSDNGFALQGVQARMLGGDVRIEGGMKANASGAPGSEAPLSLRAIGSVTAEGLRNARELGFWSRLARAASGSTAYSATLGVRQGVLELAVNSSLQGLATGLPAPLNKSADTALPLRVEIAQAPEVGKQADRVTVDIGKLASVNYVRDLSGKEARVLRGSIAVGLQPGESVPSSSEGVAANINLASVDVDAWSNALTQATGVNAPSPGVSSGSDAALSYLPNTVALRANELSYSPLQFNHIVGGGSREGLNWRVNLKTDEGSGYLELRQPAGNNAGRVYARLAQLKIAPNTAQQVETLLDEQPRSIPALDIVVDEFELRGKKLGRVEIDAVNRGALARDGGAREWRLNKFNISNPEASLTASGNWAAVSGAPVTERSAARLPERRRTVLNFKLDLNDAGGLLTRMGMKDVLRRGKGKMEGQVSWIGSPLSPDYPSLGGQFNLDVETGQFLQVEPGAAKLLGVLSLQSLPRRLTLDFRDVFSSGFAFDFVRGDVQISNGLASTNNLQMKGVNAAVLMEGKADIVRETQDLRVIVVPEINAGTASLVAGIINPAIGLGSFLAQLFLRRPLIEANTQEFHIDGTWTDYKVTKVPHKAVAEATNAPAPAASAASAAAN